MEVTVSDGKLDAVNQSSCGLLYAPCGLVWQSRERSNTFISGRHGDAEPQERAEQIHRSAGVEQAEFLGIADAAKSVKGYGDHRHSLYSHHLPALHHRI